MHAAEGGHLDVLEGGLPVGRVDSVFVLQFTMHTALRELVADYALKQPRLRRRPGEWRLDERFAYDCAWKGLLRVLQWAREEHKCPLDGRLYVHAAAEGHLEVLKWLQDKDGGCPWVRWTLWFKWAFARAAEGGHLEVLQWLRKEGCPWDEWACAFALCWGCSSGFRGRDARGTCRHAYPTPKKTSTRKWRGGYVGTIHNSQFTMHTALRELVADYALKQPRLRRRPGEWRLHERFACDCAWKGLLRVLQWARNEHKCPLEERLYVRAAAEGHLEVLKWLRKEGCPWIRWTLWFKWAFARAAKGGHLEVLQWLRKEGCPWDEWACALAAEGGHLEVLQWLQREGCPWDVQTCISRAEEKEYPEVAQWIRNAEK